MSAYVVDRRCIDVIVSFAFDQKLTKTPTALGRTLWRENVRSVNFRYSNHAPRKVPPYRWAELTPYTLASVREALLEYDYQACECDDYESTQAAQQWRALVHRLQAIALKTGQTELLP